MTRHGRLRARRGFSLVEIMVAMMLLATVLSALATLSWRVTKRGEDNDLRAKRSFALQHEANRYGAMTFAEIGALTNGSEAVILGDFLFTRTLTVTAVGTTRYQIKVVVEPSDEPASRDSIIFDRIKTSTYNPLCTSC